MQATPQQTAFIVALLTTTANLALLARAGCGKTSTILLGVDAYAKEFPSHEAYVCAFNKAIADEVQVKLEDMGYGIWAKGSPAPKVQAGTIHKMGFSLVRFVYKGVQVDGNKVYKLIDAAAEAATRADRHEEAGLYAQYGSTINQLVGLAKGEGVGYFDDQPIADPATWLRIADHYDVDGIEDAAVMGRIVQLATAIYNKSLAQTNVVDFNDMVLFPLIKNLKVKFGKHLIIADEAQDLSRTKQALIMKFLAPGGRVAVVGDDRQAIYGFSGADAEALPRMIARLKAVVLPLTTTWRCPTAVVELAKTLVPDIEAAPGAKAGAVTTLPAVDVATITTEDAILCRNTAPLIKLAYSLLRAGKPCKVEGRAIGDGLIKLAQRWQVVNIEALLNKLEAYRLKEVAKALDAHNDAKAEEVDDRVMTLVEICNTCLAAQQYKVADVVAFIDKLFADSAEGVTTLATYHRAKGREWNRVILFEHAKRCPTPYAKQAWQVQQEANLAYVAFTRAKAELVFAG